MSIIVNVIKNNENSYEKLFSVEMEEFKDLTDLEIEKSFLEKIT